MKIRCLITIMLFFTIALANKSKSNQLSKVEKVNFQTNNKIISRTMEQICCGKVFKNRQKYLDHKRRDARHQVSMRQAKEELLKLKTQMGEKNKKPPFGSCCGYTFRDKHDFDRHQNTLNHKKNVQKLTIFSEVVEGQLLNEDLLNQYSLIEWQEYYEK